MLSFAVVGFAGVAGVGLASVVVEREVNMASGITNGGRLFSLYSSLSISYRSLRSPPESAVAKCIRAATVLSGVAAGGVSEDGWLAGLRGVVCDLEWLARELLVQ